jgi:hypothetical protein
VTRLTPAARVDLALRLGEEDIATLVRARTVTPADARRLVARWSRPVPLSRSRRAVTLLARASVVLSNAHTPYAWIGAAARALHGVSRSTLAQDLLVTDAGSGSV